MAKELLKGELIGSEIEIMHSKNKTLIGKTGKIIDETRNTITLETNSKKIKVLKSHITFKIKNKIIDGKKIVGKPEDRIKK